MCEGELFSPMNN